MNKFVEAVKEMDGFSHTQFLRYRQEDSYRTFLGGCTTISLIILSLSLAAIIFSFVVLVAVIIIVKALVGSELPGTDTTSSAPLDSTSPASCRIVCRVRLDVVT